MKVHADMPDQMYVGTAPPRVPLEDVAFLVNEGVDEDALKTLADTSPSCQLAIINEFRRLQSEGHHFRN